MIQTDYTRYVVTALERTDVRLYSASIRCRPEPTHIELVKDGQIAAEVLPFSPSPACVAWAQMSRLAPDQVHVSVILAAVSPASAGSYRVLVHNSGGCSKSNDIRIQVLVRPR